MVRPFLAVVVDDDRCRPTTSTTVPSSSARTRSPASRAAAALDTGADERRGGPQQRHGLALHVGAHERAVGVVVLEERDQRASRPRRSASATRPCSRPRAGRRTRPRRDGPARAPSRRGTGPASSTPGVGLRDDVAVLVVGGEVLDLVGGDAVRDLAVRRLDEAEPVDARVRRQVADEADVRAFRRLDRAHPAVVAGVHVADLEAGALTRQTARARAPRGGACG